MENPSGLSGRHYGCRAGRSTIGAIKKILTSVNAVQSGSRFSRKIVLLATFDVRNAFNSLLWVDVIDSLRKKFTVPGYLMKIMQLLTRS